MTGSRMRRRWRVGARGTAILVCALSTLVAVPAGAARIAAGGSASPTTSVPDPTLAGPVVTTPHLDGTRGIPYTSSAVDLATHGYTEQEYFVTGTARAYEPTAPLTPDGKWNVTVSSTADYKTRFIVRRPIDMS